MMSFLLVVIYVVNCLIYLLGQSSTVLKGIGKKLGCHLEWGEVKKESFFFFCLFVVDYLPPTCEQVQQNFGANTSQPLTIIFLLAKRVKTILRH